MKRFEEIPHTADWSFRAFGKDVTELFENAAFAMFALQGGLKCVSDRATETARAVEASGIDYEALLVNWLSELLYLQESHHEIYHRFRIDELSPSKLRAQVFGTPYRKLDKLVKAVTYHNLEIKQMPNGWEAIVVVDV